MENRSFFPCSWSWAQSIPSFTISMMLHIGFFGGCPLTDWGISLFFLICCEFLSWGIVGFCKILFLWIYWSYYMACYFSSFNILNYIDWLSNAKASLYYWDKSFVHDILDYLLNFCQEFLHLCSWRILVSNFPFFNLSNLGIRLMLARYH